MKKPILSTTKVHALLDDEFYATTGYAYIFDKYEAILNMNIAGKYESRMSQLHALFKSMSAEEAEHARLIARAYFISPKALETIKRMAIQKHDKMIDRMIVKDGNVFSLFSVKYLKYLLADERMANLEYARIARRYEKAGDIVKSTMYKAIAAQEAQHAMNIRNALANRK